MLLRRIAYWLPLGSLAFAGTIPKDPLKATPVAVEERAATSSAPDGACTNSPNTRNCWHDGFSISTDFDAKSPPAGKTVTYDLEITNTTLNPDGHVNPNGDPNKIVMLINNQYPGPVLRATWGDTLVVNVKNSLQHNGTGLHFHGIRQWNSCQHDGVPGVTECPIAPGKSRQYVFKLTQFGTTWYHSHWASQYAEGVWGTLIIDGPATWNYDYDLGTLPLTEWYYTPGFTVNEQAQHSKFGPPKPDNILINGTHVNADGGGSYYKMTVKKGKKYRVRLINTSADTTFHVSFDGHPFQVMTSDFVPVKSFPATQLTLNIGQRYDVVINANQTAGNYWFRVGIGSCSSNKITDTKIQLGAILHYDSVDDGTPGSTGVTLQTHCDDETGLVPFVPNTVPNSVVPSATKMDLNSKTFPEDNNLFRWTIDGSEQIVNWNEPSLVTTLNGGSSYGEHSNVYEMTTANQWYLWYIQSTAAVTLPHPIHLHGHDFYIMGSGVGTWDGTSNGLVFQNPTRRDTAMLPSGGYLLLAFPADNPGLWVMHCHIAWHASQGLSVQFLERKGEIKEAIRDYSGLTQGCSEWDDYWQPGKHPYNQTDSGI